MKTHFGKMPQCFSEPHVDFSALFVTGVTEVCRWRCGAITERSVASVAVADLLNRWKRPPILCGRSQRRLG